MRDKKRDDNDHHRMQSVKRQKTYENTYRHTKRYFVRTAIGLYEMQE
jgi:hypothetical protein